MGLDKEAIWHVVIIVGTIVAIGMLLLWPLIIKCGE
jgi:hypothetical protein